MTPVFGSFGFQQWLGSVGCVLKDVPNGMGGSYCPPLGGASQFQAFFGWDLITMSVAVIIGASIAAYAVMVVLRKVAGV